MYFMFAFEEADRSLTIGFRAKSKEEFLKVNLGDEAFVFFPEKIHLPRQPRMRFENLENARFEGAVVNLQDRSFQVRFDTGYTIVFLLYGRNGNILLYKGANFMEAFRKNISTGTDKTLGFYNTGLLPDAQGFMSLAKEDARKAVTQYFPAFPKSFLPDIPENYTPEEAWKICLQVDDELSSAGLKIIDDGIKPIIEAGKENTSIRDLMNTYARLFYRYRKERQDRQRELSKLMAEKKRLEKNIASLRTHIASLGQARNYRHQADLLMANMHAIQPGADKVTVQDFETGKDVILKLKKELSPQAWAEKLYRKSRGQQKEKEITEAQLKQAEEKLLAAEGLLENQAKGESISIKSSEKSSRKTEEKESPFRSVTFQGYTIYIGKSASNNDDLTFRFAHKEDTWLHARGVSGSHVIIRHKAKGKDIPKPVLEAAAALAAFNSKAKHSSLVPVAYTLRKFVRKPKGAAPGAVVVEKEKVILVEPSGKIAS